MIDINVNTQNNSNNSKISTNTVSEKNSLITNEEEIFNSIINTNNSNINQFKRKLIKTKFNHRKRNQNNAESNETPSQTKRKIKANKDQCRIKYKIQSKVPRLKNTQEIIKSVNWKIIEQFLEIENNEALSSLYSLIESSNKQNPIFDILETDINEKPIIESNFTVCKIKKTRKKAHYLVFNILKHQFALSSGVTDISSITEEGEIFSTIEEEEIVNNTQTNINNLLSLKTLKFKNDFQINSFSKKILELEKSISNSVSLDSDNSYIINQLIIKREMLREIIHNNLGLTKEIGLNSRNDVNSMKDIANLGKEQKKNKNLLCYKTIYKRLSEGLKDKTYPSLISDVNPIRLNQEDIKQDIIKTYESKSECCVCLAYCPYSASHISYCYKCNVGIHTNCYGLPYKPIWFRCDLCSNNLNNNNIHSLISSIKSKTSQNIKCIFCRQSHGALKKIGNQSSWGHVTCVLLSSYAYFSDYIKLDSIIWLDSLEETILLTNIDYCDICNDRDGEKFDCISCGRRYHFFCAYFKGYKIELYYNASVVSKKSAKIQIKQCPFDILYNKVERNEQSILRQLIYHKMKSILIK